MILKTRIDCEPFVTWQGRVYWIHKAEFWTREGLTYSQLCTEFDERCESLSLHETEMDYMDCPVASRWTLIRAGI